MRLHEKLRSSNSGFFFLMIIHLARQTYGEIQIVYWEHICGQDILVCFLRVSSKTKNLLHGKQNSRFISFDFYQYNLLQTLCVLFLKSCRVWPSPTVCNYEDNKLLPTINLIYVFGMIQFFILKWTSFLTSTCRICSPSDFSVLWVPDTDTPFS